MGNILADQERFLLASKIQVPPQKSDLVLRPELNKKLDLLCEPGVKLALVIAPPGFGKTSLVGDWVYSQGLKTAWFSIEESEDYPLIFWQYFVSAIQRSVVDFENPFIFTSAVPAGKEIHSRVITFINRLADLNEDLLIVLDDLHHLVNVEVLQELKYFVEHLPANLKMIIASQLSPDWPLMKLKASGSLVEINTSDLAFSFSETMDLLHKMNLPWITESEVKNLVDQSEGWVFGIQLTAVAATEKNSLLSSSLQNRYISEYLVEEVLNILPETTQNFLNDISILDTVCANLCTHLTERTDSGELLAFLEHRNLFLLPVDDQKEWYRFHRLFLELLRSRQNKLPESRKTLLHSKASEWFEDYGEITLAIDHALQSGNYDRTVNLVEKNLFRILDHNELLKQSELVSKLPAEILNRRPELAITNAWLLAYIGKCTEAEAYLSLAEFALDQEKQKSAIRPLVGKILAVRSYIWWLRGENDKTIKTSGQALINLAPDDRMNRSITLIAMGEALEDVGKTSEALEAFTDAIDTCSFEHCAHVHILACAAKIRLMIMVCQLEQAESLSMEIIHLINEKHPRRVDRCAALGNIFAHRAEIYRCWNQLSRALELAAEGVAFGRKWDQADTVITTSGIKAAVLWTMGEKDAALKIYDGIKPLAAGVSPWYVNYLDAYMIILGVDPARLKSFCRWFNLNTDISLDEYRHHDSLFCRARIKILCSQKRYGEAMDWLELVSRDAQASGTHLVYADTRVVKALCLFGLGKFESARQSLCEALELIRSKHIYSLILDKGQPMIELLTNLPFEPPLDELVNQLLAMAQKRSENRDQKAVQPAPSLIELSNREHEILGYLATHKTSAEIAEMLTVSPNTVRFHIKSIYNKLDVHSRDEAVELARSIGLIS
jgi:LuxR family maltose regulon positive regulatory protein